MSENMTAKELVQKQFGRTSEGYVQSQSHATGDDLEKTKSWLAALPARPTYALDIATGGGHMAKTIAPYVTQVFATDLTHAMLSSAYHHLHGDHVDNVFFVSADAEALPFLDSTFDLVTCRIAAHHFPNPTAFVREVARVLKPGGMFIFIDNIAPSDDAATFLNAFEQMRDESHVRCLSTREWETLFQQYGLSIQASEVLQSKHVFADWLRRMAQSDAQMQSVEAFMLTASEQMKQEFAIEIVQNHITSFHLHKWIACSMRNQTGV